MIRTTRTRCLTLMVLLACSTVASSQTSDHGSGNDEHDCAKAAKILARGKPQRKEAWALSTIAGCRGGAAYLATAWEEPPTDSVALWHLQWGSLEVRDRRIVSAVATTVTQVSLPHAVRFAAINILLAQYDRSSRLMPNWDPTRGAVGKVAEAVMTDGEQPIEELDRQLIASTVLGLANTDADSWMRDLARIVAADMGWRPWRPAPPLGE